MNLTTLCRQLIAVTLLSLPGMASSQPASRESCTVSAAPSRRLELADGHIVSIDVKDLAQSGGHILALGRYAHLFPRDASPTTAPVSPDSTVGVWIDGRGVVRLVASPMRERSISFARAAGGTSGSFHVLFATGVDSVDMRVVSTDTATLWYARYANGSWRDIERITAVTGAALDTEFTSELLAIADDLSFVFPFVDGIGREPGGGVIALRRRGNRWSSDTLRNTRAPTAVRAKIAQDQSIIALVVQFDPSARVENVFHARLTDRWTTPRRIGEGIKSISDVALGLSPGGDVASWSTWRWGNASTNTIRWTRLRAPLSDRLEPTTVIDSGEATYPFEFVSAGSHLLWFYHGEPLGQVARYVLAAAGAAEAQRGNLTIPFYNARARAIALTADRVVLFTMKRGFEATEPMMASWRTDVRIRCSNPARR